MYPRRDAGSVQDGKWENEKVECARREWNGKE